MPIQNLATHPAFYVTVAELAEYWAVSRHQIHKRIESGHLNAIRLGERLYRVRTQAALEFERQSTASAPPGRKAKRPVAAISEPLPAAREPNVEGTATDGAGPMD